MVKFVLVGTQRTGTTLIRTTLDSHPDVLCIGEAFTRAGGIWIRKEQSTGNDWRHDALSYRRYATSSVLRRVGHVAWRSRQVDRYLDWIYSQSGVQAIGFKLMWQKGFPSLVPSLLRTGVRVIHVIRENPFDTYLSRLTRKARGIAHTTQEDVRDVSVTIPIGDLLDTLENIAGEGERWRQTFEGRVPYLRVTYETFVLNPLEETDRMARFLDVAPGLATGSSLKKLNKGSLADLVGNLDDVRRCLAGTAFEWCLAGRD